MFGGKSAKDVWISVDIMTYPGKHAGVVFRGWASMKYYYECLLNVHRKKIDLTVYEDGRARSLKSVSVPWLNSNTNLYNLCVGMFDNHITVYLASPGISSWKKMIDIYDDTLKTSGLAGTSTYHKGGVFKDLRVYKYD